MTRDTVTVPREAWAEVRHFVECRATDSGTTRDLLNRIDVAAPSSDPEGGARGERALDLLAIEAACKFIYEDKGDRKGVTYVGWDGEPDDVKDQWREDVVATVRAYLDASTKSDGSGIRVEEKPRSHGESLQKGPDTSSTIGTAGESAHGEMADAASVANQVAASDRASHAAPGPSDQLTKTPSADHDDGNLRGLAEPNHQPHAVSQGWRDIETAPKDGTKVLAYWFGNDMPFISVIWWRGDKYPDSSFPWRNTSNDGAIGGFGQCHLPKQQQTWRQGPTHWMPLPAPPSPAKTGGAS